ncbi:MAG TPA: hypothetical protein VGU71_10355 [Candidatus Dormibacteraeota bacterium]|nr:hypothetical protein [Candidatus Dormibacteraeota bacterium]
MSATTETLSASRDLRPSAVAAGALLAAGWLVAAVALIIHPVPQGGGGLAAQLALAAADPADLLLFSVLYLASAIVVVPALILVTWRPVGRGKWFIFAAAVIMLIGALGHAGESALVIALVAVASLPGDQHQSVEALTKVGAYVGPILVLAAIFHLGVLLMGAAVWRARLAPPWPLALLIVGEVIGNLVPPSKPVIALSLGVVTAGGSAGVLPWADRGRHSLPLSPSKRFSTWSRWFE